MLNDSGSADTIAKYSNVVEIYVLLSWKLLERACGNIVIFRVF